MTKPLDQNKELLAVYSHISRVYTSAIAHFLALITAWLAFVYIIGTNAPMPLNGLTLLVIGVVIVGTGAFSWLRILNFRRMLYDLEKRLNVVELKENLDQFWFMKKLFLTRSLGKFSKGEVIGSLMVICFYVITIYSTSARLHAESFEDFNMEFSIAFVTALATVVVAIYAVVQGELMRKDLQESKLQRSAHLALYVIDAMNDLRDKRHESYGLPSDHHKWNVEQKKLADLVGVKLQQVAFLAETGLIDEKYLFENYASVFATSWKKLENYIQDYRKDTKEPTQRIHFERFAKKCMKYLKSHQTTTET